MLLNRTKAPRRAPRLVLCASLAATTAIAACAAGGLLLAPESGPILTQTFAFATPASSQSVDVGLAANGASVGASYNANGKIQVFLANGVTRTYTVAGYAGIDPNAGRREMVAGDYAYFSVAKAGSTKTGVLALNVKTGASAFYADAEIEGANASRAILEGNSGFLLLNPAAGTTTPLKGLAPRAGVYDYQGDYLLVYEGNIDPSTARVSLKRTMKPATRPKGLTIDYALYRLSGSTVTKLFNYQKTKGSVENDPESINAKGEAVGVAYPRYPDPAQWPIHWSATGAATLLPDPPGYERMYPQTISDDGLILATGDPKDGNRGTRGQGLFAYRKDKPTSVTLPKPLEIGGMDIARDGASVVFQAGSPSADDYNDYYGFQIK